MSCTIVVGCYRTGSSAIAGILHHLGVSMGQTFDPPADSNPKGYWEDVEFKKLHERFYAGEDPIDEYRALVKYREAKHERWGVKDPLLCFFLPKLLECLSTEARLITCRRPIQEIADSMSKAIRCPNNDFVPLVKHYLESMDKVTSEFKGPHLSIWPISTIAFDAKQLVEDIAHWVGVPVTTAALEFMEVK